MNDKMDSKGCHRHPGILINVIKEAHNVKKAGKKINEFPTPYTVTNALTKGNIITKISMLIMGLGDTVRYL